MYDSNIIVMFMFHTCITIHIFFCVDETTEQLNSKLSVLIMSSFSCLSENNLSFSFYIVQSKYD